MQITSVERVSREFCVCWSDGCRVLIPFIWLRDNDPDELHPHTAERVFDLTTVNLDIEPLGHTSNADGLVVQWPGKDERSTYSAQWLYQHRPGQVRHDPADIPPVIWQNTDAGNLPRFSAIDCARSDKRLLQALQALKRNGLIIFNGLDDHSAAGEIFGKYIGFKRQTNFGVMFEVTSKPEPNNLAYTSLALPLHTDLPNQEVVPGYQILHCYRNSANGGASVFADGFRICVDVQADSSAEYDLLCELSLPWRFHDEDDDVRFRRPIIELDASGNLCAFTFNAHIADIPDFSSEQLPSFYMAYRKLMQRIRDPKYRCPYLLQPGEMVMFDNRRILHGREAFDAQSGTRHLYGYYIEHNEVDSKIRVLAK